MVSLMSEQKATAVLYVPLLRLKRAFCPSARVASGIASVRWRADGLRVLDCKADEVNMIRTGGMLGFIPGEFRKHLASLSSQFAASGYLRNFAAARVPLQSND